MSICAECSKLQKTCCQLSDIILTDQDIVRLKKIGYDNFFEYRQPADFDYGQEEDPNWNAYTLRRDRNMQLLKKKDNGDCIFLTALGCELKEEIRPLICLLYPYYYNENQLLRLDPYKCPKGWINQDALKQLNITEKNAQKWHQQFYQELKQGRIYYENRNNV